MYCVHPTVPVPSQVEGRRSAEAEQKGKKVTVMMRMVEEDRQSHKKDVDPGLSSLS